MKTSDLDKELMGQFVVESMTNGVDEPQGLSLSDDFNIASMQEQGAMWCMRSKMLMLSDLAEPNSMQGRFAASMKIHMQKDFRQCRAMSYLYESDQIDVLTQQVSMLAMHATFKDVNDIYNVNRAIESQSLDPETVSVSVALYTYFTICYNKNVTPNHYNELFIRAWYSYYENWMPRRLMFQMNGNRWKSSFIGVLCE